MSHGFLIKQKWPRSFIDAPGSAFPEVSKQTGQPREVNPNFRKFLPGSFLSIQPCSQNLLTESWGESILRERLTGGTVAAINVPVGTEARGDVLFVITSKPVENL